MRRIKRVLFEREISQRDVAKASRIDTATFSRIVNGEIVVYSGWAKRIAEALGWTGDPQELFEEVD